MIIESTKHKSKTWGVIELPYAPGHFLTGYQHSWPDGNMSRGDAYKAMKIGENRIISGLFRIGGMGRGMSAANFSGSFKGHDHVSYTLSMSGTMLLLTMIQNGTAPIVDGYIDCRWTFAKQGKNIFIEPVAA